MIILYSWWSYAWIWICILIIHQIKFPALNSGGLDGLYLSRRILRVDGIWSFDSKLKIFVTNHQALIPNVVPNKQLREGKMDDLKNISFKKNVLSGNYSTCWQNHFNPKMQTLNPRKKMRKVTPTTYRSLVKKNLLLSSNLSLRVFSNILWNGYTNELI